MTTSRPAVNRWARCTGCRYPSKINFVSREWKPSWACILHLRLTDSADTRRRIGYAAWIGKPAENDSVLVEILYELGAVPFVRTNVPQTLMVWHAPQCFTI